MIYDDIKSVIENNHFEKMLVVLGETTGAYLFMVDIGQEPTYYFSPELLEKFCFPKEEGPLSGAWAQAILPADRKHVQGMIEQLWNGQVDSLDLDCRLLNRRDERVWVNLRAYHVPKSDDQPAFLMGSVREIDGESRADAVTGLLNQRQFSLDYSGPVAEGDSGYFVFIGIDNFKAANERYGVQMGNQLLRRLAIGLEEHIAPDNRIYRLDGDKFAVVLAEKNQMAAATFYSLVKKSLTRICRELESGLYCTISAGAAGYPYDSQNYTELGQFAENALNTAKQQGKNNLVFFSRDAYEDHLFEVGLREALQQSVSNHFAGFEIYYQPQVSVKTGEITGAEALLRWQNSKFGRVSPVLFIPVLEQIGLISQVGRWVLNNTMEQCRLWRRFIPDFIMSINLSYQQFETDDIPGLAHQNLNRLGLPGGAITLELVESLQMQDFRFFNEIFSYLNRIGIAVSIDDFGTGYSSLGYFKELNINEIKVDRTFVARMLESAYDYDLVRFIIELAHGAGARVCVEGVETLDEVQALLPLSPDNMQGFFFGRPAPAEDFEERFLQQWGSNGHILRDYASAHANDTKADVTPPFYASEETFAELLDELDEIVYVSEPGTQKVLYLNRAGRTMLGVQNYEGMRCHTLFGGNGAPCDGCADKKIGRDRFTVLDCHNASLGGAFQMRQKLIPWKGQLALLAMSVGLGQSEPTSMESRTRLETERVLRGCVRVLGEEENPETALDAVLKSVGEYHQADRAYLFSFAPGTDIATNTHEWCRPGVPPERDAFPHLLFSAAFPAFYKLFSSGRPVVTGDGPQFEKSYPKEYDAIQPYTLRRMILAPLLLKGKLIGFVGVDNPAYNSDNPELLLTLSAFLAQAYGLSRLESELYRSRFVDASTGLLNRDRYLRDIGVLDGGDIEHSVGVVYIEAPGYKKRNLQQGHQAGDLMLQTLAQHLQAAFEGAKHYRIGTDEFLVLCQGVRETDVTEGCRRLRTACCAEEDFDIRLGYSFAAIDADIQTLLEQAYQDILASKAPPGPA